MRLTIQQVDTMELPRRERTLDPAFVLEAYTAGFFPMADPKSGDISWYSPDPRSVLPLAGFHITRSLRTIVRKGIFEIRINTAFDQVITGCSLRAETWISEDVREAFLALHKNGFAHSVEAWQSGNLAGGLYGLAIRGAFFGESMFSLLPNSSKVALVHLVQHLRARKFDLLDVQFMTSHLAGLGAIEIPRSVYMKRLAKALRSQSTFS